MARTYIISEICGDWSLHIKGPGTSNNFLFFKSRNNAELVKSILEWEDAHPNKAVPYKPTLTPPNEWVSVDERLPEVGQEVLVYWRNTSQKAEHFELTHYDGDHWFLLDNTERPWIVVVAWMPLPSPPDRRPPEGEEGDVNRG